MLSETKAKVFIWGTGEAGKATYKRIRRKVHVLGFIDNDKKKVGQSLFRKTIYAPEELLNRSFDSVIVASMYHSEITAQLINDLKIPVEKIEIRPMIRKKKGTLYKLVNRLTFDNYEYFMRLKKEKGFRLASLAAHYYLHEPIRENYVLYESYNGKDFAGNPHALFRYLINHEDYQHLHHVIVMIDINHPKLIPYRNHPRVTIVEMNSEEFIRYAESCKYYINNVSYKPYLIKKKDQIYVYTWHSTLLKKLAADSNFVWESKNTSRALLAADYFISPNRYTTENLLRCLCVDSLMQGVITEFGYPRNDFLFNTDKDEIRRKLGVPQGKKLVVFAPTWRGEYVPEDNISETLEYYQQIKKGISDEYHLVIKFHTMVYPLLTSEALALSVPQDIDTNQLLAATDLLITDYSGIFFDYLITRNPIVFFTPDRQAYGDARSGFYLDLDELPGPICDTVDDVVHAINNIESVQKQYSEQYNSFCQRFVSADDGHVCERVVDLVFKNKSFDNVYRLTHHRKNVLVYPGSLATNGVTSSFLALLDNSDYQKYNIVVLLPSDTVFRQNQRKINKNAKIFYQVTTDGYTRREYRKVLRMERIGKGGEDQEIIQAYQRNLRRIFYDIEFDTVINFNGYVASWAAKLCFGIKAKKKVIYLHSDQNEDRKNKTPDNHGVFPIYPFYDKLFCVSEDSLDANKRGMAVYVKKVLGFDITPKMDYVNNLIIPDLIKHNAEQLKTVAENGKEYCLIANPIDSNPSLTYSFLVPMPLKENVNFITVGRLSPEKNHLRLIEAFNEVQKIHQNVRLYIVGQGVMQKAIADLVKEYQLEDKVILTGYINNPYPLLERCDCFVLSSDREGQPIVVLEALTLGKYIISTDIPGPRNMLKNGEGQLVSCSSDALAEAMTRFVEEAHISYKPFDARAYVKQTMVRYEEKVL